MIIPYLEEFRDYENSPYVREKHAYGQSIGKRHCYEQTKKLSPWKVFFDSNTRLVDVTKEELRNIIRPDIGQEIKKTTNICYPIRRSRQDGQKQKDVRRNIQERGSD